MTATLDPVATGGLLAAGAPDLAGHRRRHGPLGPLRPDVLRTELRRSGLTGRGGAGFPLWRKLDALAARPGGVVVANAAEGEPASAKDRTLLHAAPHLVLDGLQIAAAAARATSAVVYVTAEAVDLVRAAGAARFHDDPVPVRVVDAPDGFLSGEETAAVNAIDGRPGLPGDKARRVVEVGVGGRPTAVANIETLAHAALVGRYGADAFRAAGTPDEPGTMLVTATVEGRQLVREVPLGVPLPVALGADVTGPVLVGGFHGAWLAGPEAAGARLSRAGLAPYGATPGAGVLIALAPGACGLAETAHIVGYLSGASARQCGPCRNGLPVMAATLHRLAAGERDASLPGEVRRLGALVTGRGACHHPDGTARLAASALRVFADDVEAHLSGHCRAGGGRRPGGARERDDGAPSEAPTSIGGTP
ncbi:NADH-ubiquinone oxidoreductase-F iron-sulfur binding region domain-containing protein [Pseudonocardia endophytica]|uniref:NADH:ubiquinone oxidoreductase subunit F (NADH-binding) n=1 Tax=Pseudonocardia endophytica TaxID=401976 RepID=A0A4R1HLT6_PSEEN|nr:NADH-ubiquinone oxidoreductase-F iron-sulfur binding region domain-containing protein [Pseudonocardia endophytica]TCK22958.1 NADH:ubiquinone oxidoreductase subunit F (NADH-binding) [Pseudonocardia endophytica]